MEAVGIAAMCGTKVDESNAELIVNYSHFCDRSDEPSPQHTYKHIYLKSKKRPDSGQARTGDLLRVKQT